MGQEKRIKGPLRFAGVDPGKKGFICVVDERCAIVTMWAIPYLDNRVDVVRLSKMFKAMAKANVRFTILEEQHAFHKEGPAGAFTNGDGFGALRGQLAMSGLRHEIEKPEVWKRSAGIPVPKVPKAVLPPKPSTKGGIAKWNKKCRSIQARRSAVLTKKRKDYSIAKAKQLQPEYDFRPTSRHRNQHDGMCEAYLLAREAWKRERRIRSTQ